MKYVHELEIDCPRDRVVELYADPENWPAWQDSLAGYQIVSGSGRVEGMKTRLSNRFGGRVVEIVETVEANRLPDELVCTYEAQGAWNRVVNRFTEIAPGKTRWEFDTEFRCRGMLRVMSLLLVAARHVPQGLAQGNAGFQAFRRIPRPTRKLNFTLTRIYRGPRNLGQSKIWTAASRVWHWPARGLRRAGSAA